MIHYRITYCDRVFGKVYYVDKIFYKEESARQWIKDNGIDKRYDNICINKYAE